METWLTLARGPFFWASLTFMILGLLRLALVSLFDVVRTARHAGDKRMPYKKLMRVTLAWLVPVDKIKHRVFRGSTSFVFHVAIIVVPIFLAGHIALWRGAIGLSWPAIPAALADILTIVAVATALVLVAQRAFARAQRTISRFSDYFLPLFIALPFVAGFLVMHPQWNPLPYDVTLFLHVMSANLLMILVPTTKLNHAAYMAESQLITEAAWHWPSDAGRRVGMALGKEGEPI